MVCVLCKLADWMVCAHVFFLLDMKWLDGHMSLVIVKKLTKEERRELFDNGVNLRN
jgi:hypothetical protein